MRNLSIEDTLHEIADDTAQHLIATGAIVPIDEPSEDDELVLNPSHMFTVEEVTLLLRTQ